MLGKRVCAVHLLESIDLDQLVHRGLRGRLERPGIWAGCAVLLRPLNVGVLVNFDSFLCMSALMTSCICKLKTWLLAVLLCEFCT